MNNFNEMPFGNDLLLAMYNTPSKQLSVEEIAKIVSAKLSTPDKTINVDPTMLRAIYYRLGQTIGKDLDLRKRLRVEPKPESNKPARVTKAAVLEDIFGQLGLTNDETPEADSEEVDATTTQEQE